MNTYNSLKQAIINELEASALYVNVRLNELANKTKTMQNKVTELTVDSGFLAFNADALPAKIQALCHDMEEKFELNVNFTCNYEPGFLTRKAAFVLYFITDTLLNEAIKTEGLAEVNVDLLVKKNAGLFSCSMILNASKMEEISSLSFGTHKVKTLGQLIQVEPTIQVFGNQLSVQIKL